MSLRKIVGALSPRQATFDLQLHERGVAQAHRGLQWVLDENLNKVAQSHAHLRIVITLHVGESDRLRLMLDQDNLRRKAILDLDPLLLNAGLCRLAGTLYEQLPALFFFLDSTQRFQWLGLSCGPIRVDSPQDFRNCYDQRCRDWDWNGAERTRTYLDRKYMCEYAEQCCAPERVEPRLLILHEMGERDVPGLPPEVIAQLARRTDEAMGLSGKLVRLVQDLGDDVECLGTPSLDESGLREYVQSRTGAKRWECFQVAWNAIMCRVVILYPD